ncbi:hypothetical protein [Candidatus Korobacter versatilis]|uniref:hypothetical protein n=1 Tax=Candidatus Korobacter versatilis TaxID=658062 RepID=UPI001E3A135D|nr:hypothetical protein [Candidatus Koribacter versatilis]
MISYHSTMSGNGFIANSRILLLKFSKFLQRPAICASCVLILATWTPAIGQTTIPPGNVLPISLNQTTKADHTHPGAAISGRLMQDVPLPAGAKIREGATVSGTVVQASPDGKQITLRFDSLDDHGTKQPILSGFRAHASYMAVSQVFIPPSGLDRSTPYSTATLILIGGDVSYRGGGPVTHGNDPVGKPVGEGVLVKVLPNPDRGCDTPYDRNDTEQALWAFSSDACGMYGYIHRKMVDRGLLNGSGQFTLATAKGKIKLQKGDGMLLIVISPTR